MIIIFFVSAVFLCLSIKSKNSLSSGLFLIMSLVVLGPVSNCLMPCWETYVLLILFVGGVFVIVVYIASVCYNSDTLHMSRLAWTFVFISPVVVPIIIIISVHSAVSGITFLFIHEYTTMEFVVLVVLIKTVFFVSYFLYSAIAIRKW